MDPRQVPSPQNQEQARQRRDEAARRQQIQLKEQARKIEQQRLLAARQKNGTAPAKPPASAPVNHAAPPKNPAWTKVAEVTVETSPPAARAQKPAALSPPRAVVPPPASRPAPGPAAPPVATPVEAAPRAESSSPPSKPTAVVLKVKPGPAMLPEPLPDLGEADVQMEPAEWSPPAGGRGAPEPASPPQTSPPPRSPASLEPRSIEQLPEIEMIPPPPELPPLRVMLPGADAMREAAGEDLEVEVVSPDFGDDSLDLKMEALPDLYCPKCQVLIPESHIGSFYTACPKCGEIIKMK